MKELSPISSVSSMVANKGNVKNHTNSVLPMFVKISYGLTNLLSPRVIGFANAQPMDPAEVMKLALWAPPSPSLPADIMYVNWREVGTRDKTRDLSKTSASRPLDAFSPQYGRSIVPRLNHRHCFQ
ncbi:hypothetical protein J6590_057895 [Homalodisca vitripennis]|nr:hypothetical protein J6590_057895 [Homalodisca vitripennis]